MNYFTNCRTVEEIKTEYRKLAKLHHPDLGGDTATMQAINAAYHAALARCDGQTSHDDEGREHRYTYDRDIEQAIMEKIAAILAFLPQSCELLLIGRWIWILNTTREDKDTQKKLKDEKAMWHAKRLCWYWRALEARHYGRQSKHDLAGLAARYGCNAFRSRNEDENRRPEYAPTGELLKHASA